MQLCKEVQAYKLTASDEQSSRKGPKQYISSKERTEYKYKMRPILLEQLLLQNQRMNVIPNTLRTMPRAGERFLATEKKWIRIFPTLLAFNMN